MDTSKVLSLLEQLDEEIDDLQDALSPLVATALSETASKLPLLDKSKLYVLVTYAIESILFSYLRLHGVKAREHPVFTELTRVKQYFNKIKNAENPVGKRENLSVDKDAAARMIKAGLSGNDKYDLQKAEQQAKERAKAHIKFEQISEKIKQKQLSKKRKAAEQPATSESDSDEQSDSDSSSDSDSQTAANGNSKLPSTTNNIKVQKKAASGSQDVAAAQTTSAPPSSKKNQKKKSKEKKRRKKNTRAKAE